MKSFVSGVGGFIGSHLTEKLLAAGHEVIGVDCFIDYYPREMKEKNMESFIDHINFSFIEENINYLDLRELLSDVDYIFHQAAQAGVRIIYLYMFKNIILLGELIWDKKM